MKDIVVNMNYELAPSVKYPTPLRQLNEAYAFIAQEADTYGIDMNRVYFVVILAGTCQSVC